MASTTNEVVVDIPGMIKVYKDGTVERIFGTPFVPPSPEDPTTGVSSKDIQISSQISARLYFPKMKLDHPNQKLPVLVYFHGGGFCVESAFSLAHHRYINLLVSEAKAIAVSVEYRSAPEHLLPAAYEDSWAALQWVASHFDVVDESSSDYKEPWLINHGDFSKLYIGGDSAGGNIAHVLGMKAGVDSLNGDVKIKGGILSFPYFWGSNSKSKSTEINEESLPYIIWMFVYPSAAGGIDNPKINPLAHDAPSLSGLGFPKMFVCVGEKDELRDTTLLYVDAVKKSGWKGEVELVDVEGEDHCFQIFNPDSENARSLISRLASFINA